MRVAILIVARQRETRHLLGRGVDRRAVRRETVAVLGMVGPRDTDIGLA